MEFIHQARHDDTIAALATPPGVGGIAIIRVSGNKALSAVQQLLTFELTSLPSHTVRLSTIYSLEKKVLDKVLVLPMHAPRSFTGQDVVEIHCHGGYLIAKKILAALFTVGVRPAGPGEFSFRAFMNDKMDLTQAEAIQDAISAQNEEALRVAQEHLEGRLSKIIGSIQRKATDIAAIFEAWVDFPEEDLEFCSFDDVISDLMHLRGEIDTLLATFDNGKIISHGISLCILGSPNVGKSSLMNALLGKQRAIVSPIAGTTRDIVEDDLHLNGLHFRLTDTAGIRNTDELIEQEGVRRSKEAMGKADLVLAVLDATRPDDPDMLDPLKDIPGENCIVVWNKVDLAQKRPLPSHNRPYVVEVSAMTHEGIEELSKAIDAIIWKQKTLKKDEVIITNIRHKEALEKANRSLKLVVDGVHHRISPEFISIDMKEALTALGTILGTNITNDILHSIFSRFCIGK